MYPLSISVAVWLFDSFFLSSPCEKSKNLHNFERKRWLIQRLWLVLTWEQKYGRFGRRSVWLSERVGCVHIYRSIIKRAVVNSNTTRRNKLEKCRPSITKSYSFSVCIVKNPTEREICGIEMENRQTERNLNTMNWLVVRLRSFITIGLIRYRFGCMEKIL